MAITVRDLYQYNPNFDPKDIERLTGKKNFKKTDTIDLARVQTLNDKKFSVFVAEKEGKSFVNSITDDNMQTYVADATGVVTVGQNQNTQNSSIPSHIPMDKSVFDYQRPSMT